MEDRTHHVTVSLARNYEFIAEFPDVPNGAAVLLDEPVPLGDTRAPNAAAMLDAAVGNCLAALRVARADENRHQQAADRQNRDTGRARERGEERAQEHGDHGRTAA